MNSILTRTRRRLILERFSASGPGRMRGELSAGKLDRLWQDDVSTVFVISSEVVDADAYLNLVKRYESEGFRVRNIHIERLDDTAIPNMKKIVEEIGETFKRESCLILSYGRSLAPLAVACYYVAEGSSPSKAISRVRKMDSGFVTKTDEVAFIYKFKRFLNILSGDNDDDYIFQPVRSDEDGVYADEELPRYVKLEPDQFSERAGALLSDRYKMPIPAETERERTGEPDDLQPVLDLDDLADDELLSPEIRGHGAGDDMLPEIRPVRDEEVRKAPDTVPGLHSGVKAPEGVPVPVEARVRMQTVDGVVTAPVATKSGTDAVPATERSKPRADTAEHIPGIKDEKLGIYSIRFKLVSIISGIIVIALTGMILLATYFFKSDNELRAWENNQKFSEVTGLKVKSDFLSIIERSRIIPGIIGKLNPEERSSLWENDEDFVFIGVAVKAGGNGLRFIKALYNTALMEKSGISAADIQMTHASFGKSFITSFNGDVAVRNISQSFRMPVTGFSLPLYRDVRGASEQILVSYIRLDRLLKAFKTSGLINVFMVNDRGDIIAHPDGAMIVSGGNYLSLPIVKLMMKSPLDNGQMRYRDENGVAQLGSYKKIGVGGCGVIATVDEARAFEQVYRIQRWNFYLLVIVLTIAILVVFIFGKTITTPIQRLVYATSRIREGNYNIDIEPSTRDEIGLLTGSFIEMGRGLEEREKMKEAFGKFVNREIAEQVLRGEIRLGGERKNVAVFFSDIRNFTAMSEKLEPEEVVEFLNDYMTRMVKCVNATRGVVDKYIGDAIMAVWGAPVSTGNDTENAVEAALAMRRELMNFNAGRGGDKMPVITIGCGINTGPVLAGQIGSEERMEYTVIGDPVNLASRIETLNKPFGTDILVSEDSYQLIKELYRVEPMQTITVKGKTESQRIYAILGRMDDPTAPRTIQELRALLGTKEQPFHRRRDDPHEEEVKYEIHEK